VRRGGYLSHTLGLRQSFSAAALRPRVFLFSHFALMFLILKLIDLRRANFGNLKIPHLLSAHIDYDPSCF